jgi:hypothetical protein
MASIRGVRDVAVTPTWVSVPAAPHAVEVLRSVTGAVAARTVLGFDQVDDLRLAVSEAATRLIGVGGQRGTLREEIRTGPDSIVVRLVLCDAPDVQWPPPPGEHPFSWTVILALVDGATESLEDGHNPCIEMRLWVTGR